MMSPASEGAAESTRRLGPLQRRVVSQWPSEIYSIVYIDVLYIKCMTYEWDER